MPNPPPILTPGRGPNGPGPIDMRKPEASVGWRSSVPYGPGGGYANPNGVGRVGPAAASLQQPTSWYVRTGGSNNNGGTSTAVGGDRSGSDGVTNATTTFTSASAAFTSADVGKGICINTGANARRHRIVSVTNSTTVILDRTSSNASALAWVIGGAWADARAVIGDTAVSADTNSPVRSGDTVYVGAGTYRAVYAFGTNWAPAFNGQVNIAGDVTGAFTGDAGAVILTAYTTNDKTAPSASTLLNLNGKSNLLFQNLMFVNGTGAAVAATTPTSQNITFRDCAFLHGGVGNVSNWVANVTGPFQTALAWLFDRCHIVKGSGTTMQFTLTRGTGGDYDANVLIQNCTWLAGAALAIFVGSTGAGAGLGGGVRVRNNTGLGASAFFQTGASVSTTFPCVVNNCALLAVGSTGTVLNANASGQLVEDYNLIQSSTPRTNVTAGAHSISDGSYSPLIHFGQERIWNGLLRPFGEPMAASPLLGFGNDGGQTVYDLYSRPRPAGGVSLPYPAAGALERGSTSTQGSSPVPPAGTKVWQNVGPWYQDFLLPVSALATTLSVSVQRDSLYGTPVGGTLPAMLILANPKIGVSAQTIVDTGAAAQWNTLTAAAFTPTDYGWLTIRFASYDASGLSAVSFANFSPA